jgi:hypothetical protein
MLSSSIDSNVCHYGKKMKNSDYKYIIFCIIPYLMGSLGNTLGKNGKKKKNLYNYIEVNLFHHSSMILYSSFLAQLSNLAIIKVTVFKMF